MRIASGKNSRNSRTMRVIGCNIPATVELNGKIFQQPTSHGSRKAHRQQYEIRFQLEGAVRQLVVARTAVC